MGAQGLTRRNKCCPQRFREAGYSTAHFGKWHLNGQNTREHPLRSSNLKNPGELGFDYWLSISTQFNLNPILSRNGVAEQFEGDVVLR